MTHYEPLRGRWRCAAAAAVLLSLVAAHAQASDEIHLDFTDYVIGDQFEELVFDQVRITAQDAPLSPGVVAMSSQFGLGVQGGTFNAILTGESLYFEFLDATLTDVSFDWELANGSAHITAFDRTGQIIGQESVSASGSLHVGVLFPGETIAAFRVEGALNASQSIGSLTFTPLTNASWTGDADAQWDNPGNWSGAAPVNSTVTLNPHTGHTIIGPSSSTDLAALIIDADNNGVTTLELQPGAPLTVDRNTTITDRGRVAGQGELVADAIANAGTIDMSQGMHIAGSVLGNSGLLSGSGTVNAAVENTGEIRVAQGEHLAFTLHETLDNQGTINLVGGAIDAAGGLGHHGDLNMTGGAAEVFGDVNVTAGGRVNVGGSTTASFFGDVAHDGEATVADGSTASFFGDVTGNGAFAGEGVVEFLGQVSPGSSPGSMSFGGDVRLSEATTVTMELAGNTPGEEYDQLDIAGGLLLAGTLDVVLLDGFEPAAGDVFNLFSFGAAEGAFAEVNLPELGDNLAWDNQLATTGELSVMAEFLLGDMNLDGVVDTGDVAPFVLALTDPEAYLAQFGVDEDTMIALGDINGDGAFDTGDVASFVQLLVGGDTPSLPEPGTLAMLGLGGLLVLRRRGLAGSSG